MTLVKHAHRLSARDDIEARYVRALEIGSEILAEHLGLDGLTLYCQRQTGWAGTNAFHAGLYERAEKTIKINFRNLSGRPLRTYIVVLGHEFRHAFQHASNWLGFRAWTGPAVESQTAYSVSAGSKEWRAYMNRPQEIDARAYQAAYAQIVFNDPRFAEFADHLNDVVGDLPMKNDFEASCQNIPYPRETLQLFATRDGGLFWASYLQMPKAKKWTKKVKEAAWQTDWLREQKFEYVQVPVTDDDLVCD